MLRWPTDAESQKGIEAFNRFVAEVWTARQGELMARAVEEAAALAAQKDSRVKSIGDIRLGFSDPPVLTLAPVEGQPRQLAVGLALPGTGSWSLSFKAKVKVDTWRTVTVKLGKLRVKAGLRIERGEPLSARLLPGTRVTVSLGKLELGSTAIVLDLVLAILSPLLREVIREQARKSLIGLLPDPARVQAIADLGLASQEPAVEGAGVDPAALESLARQISELIQEQHMPWDYVLGAVLAADEPAAPVVGYRLFQDAAIWTGHCLAAEAVRWAAGDRADPGPLLRLLGGMEALASLTDKPGLLSRAFVPATDPNAAALQAEGKAHGQLVFQSRWQGQDVVALGHITRDQYAGAFLGSALAAVLVDHPEVRDRARRVALSLVDYVAGRQWSPAEVDEQGRETDETSATYVTEPLQVLAILRLAATLDPERYEARYQAMVPAWSILWIFGWLQSLDPQGNYYKLNLLHAMAAVLLRLEPDAEVRERLANGFVLVRQALVNHDNAWFNAAEQFTLGAQPELLPRVPERVAQEIRHELALWALRPRTWRNIDLSSSGLAQVDFKGLNAGDPTERVARQAVPVDQRPTTDFLWQRSPFSLTGSKPPPPLRPPGVDFLLPYWLARVLHFL